MRSTGRRRGISMVTTGLISIAITVLLPMATWGAEGQEKQELRADLASAARQPNTPNPTEQKTVGPVLQQRDSRYEIHRSDTFDVTFPFSPEFNQTVTVQPDGYITMTAIGSLQVAGKTIPELTELLRTSYAKILHDPVINIVMKDFEKPYFIATGEVGKPGKYELRTDTTLTEAVAIAGGFTESAKYSDVYLFRRVANNWVELKKVDVKEMFKNADLTEDLHLQPGDMVFVPKSRYSKIQRYIPSPGLGMQVTPY